MLCLIKSQKKGPKVKTTILNHLTPEILGVFWVTDEDLVKRPQNFETFDYLLDGLLTCYYQNYKDNEISDGKNFFVTSSYNEQMFVGHLKNGKTILSEIQDLMNVVKVLKSDKVKVLICNQTKDQIKKQVEKKYKNYEFIELDLQGSAAI
jgi:translation initiation factor IF-1